MSRQLAGLPDDLISSGSEDESNQAVEQRRPSGSRKRKAPYAVEEDSELEDLATLVFGNRAGFKAELIGNREVARVEDSNDASDEEELRNKSNFEDVADDLLFAISTDFAAPALPSTNTQHISEDPWSDLKEEKPWRDPADERQQINLASTSALRRLRTTESEEWVTLGEYSRRLRKRLRELKGEPEWVRDAKARVEKKPRLAFNDEDEDDESDSAVTPLRKFLQDANQMARVGSSKKLKLRPEVINIQKTRGIPVQHKGPVNSLSFHPQQPILLSASQASILYLHHIDPAAEPDPNPELLTLGVQHVGVRYSEFLGPDGRRIYFAGRRPFLQWYNTEDGKIGKTWHSHMARDEHRTMENFKTSPCGRYVAIESSDRKGVGAVNIFSTEGFSWLASAKLSTVGGLADFVWWSTGNGLSVLAKDGQIGEFSMQSERFLGIWKDEGGRGVTRIALGGKRGPGELGSDRWVAIGSNHGVVNIYERADLFANPDKRWLDDDHLDLKKMAEPARRFLQIKEKITALTFSPDGQLLAFGSREEKDALRLAHLPSYTVYKNWPTDRTPIGRLTKVAFSPQSDLLAVGNDRGKVGLWKINA
jgi:WD40 repeat protein